MAPPPPHRTAPHRTALRTQGTSSIVNGLHAGFLESDLAFEANVWNGIPNGGEYYITGSFFCHGYIPDVLDVNPNEELVTAFNTYVAAENKRREGTGEEPLAESSPEFIVKASGIEQRYVVDKTGILDPEVMHPLLRQRSDDEPSLMAEMALDAARKALADAGKTAADVDAVICAASNLERAYPAVAIEIQELLGVKGFCLLYTSPSPRDRG